MKELDRFATEYKKDMQIATKLLLIIGGAVIFSCIVSVFTTLIILDKDLNKNNMLELEHTYAGIRHTLQNTRQEMEGYGKLIATSSDIVDAVANRSPEVTSLLKNKCANLSLDFAVILDTSGVPLHNAAVGVKATSSNASIVKSALRGTATWAVEGFADQEYAIVTATPINKDGSIVGCVVTGFSIASNDFVDTIADGSNVAFTVLKESTRVATTVVDADGKRMTNTQLDNQQIIDTVFKQGQVYEGENVIAGEAYTSHYSPITSNDGTITGILFVAKTLQHSRNIISTSLKTVFPICLFLVFALIFASQFFVRWLMWRIKNVTNSLEEMATGEADLTKRCKLFIRDEIGFLVIQFDAFCDKLQTIVSEIKDSKKELARTGTELANSTQDAASSITQIIANIQGVHTQITNSNQCVTKTANVVEAISSEITSLDNLIKGQAEGVAEASTAVEEMIGTISTVNHSVDMMASSFQELSVNAQNGFSKQQAVNERITQIEKQSEMLQEANLAISSIASQTNLLAMNAAIEAAHAGDAGKGFSVVADEIRKLSETSSKQSKTIGEQLTKIKESISEVVSASAESSEAFAAVSSKISKTDELVVQIKTAMEEQNAGSKQIGNALRNMNESTIEVRRASKEMADKSEQVLSEMHTLQNSSVSMAQSIEEMSRGAKKINETGSNLSNISQQVEDSIEKIGSHIDLFTV